MKLSIIIPIYNVETTLKRCLDSIISQDMTTCEMILINDGSTDNSGNIAKDYACHHANIYYYEKNNGGLSEARNWGIERASGDYITFVDSDDTVQVNTYNRLIHILEQHPEYDILEYPVLQNPGCPNETHFSPGNHLFENPLEWLSYKGFEHCWACNKIFKRSLFKNVHFSLKRKYEDILILPSLFAKNPVIATTSVGCYQYYYNENGIAAKDNSDGLKNLLKAQMEVTQQLGIDTQQEKFHRLYLNMYTAQLYTYRKTRKIELWSQKINIKKYGTKSDTLKAILLDILGLKLSCILFKYFY